MSVDESVGCEIVFASRLAPTGIVPFWAQHPPEKNLNTRHCKKPRFEPQNPPQKSFSPPTSPMLRPSHLPTIKHTSAANVQVFLTPKNNPGTSARHLGRLQRVLWRTHVRSVQKRDIFCCSQAPHALKFAPNVHAGNDPSGSSTDDETARPREKLHIPWPFCFRRHALGSRRTKVGIRRTFICTH